MHKILCVALLVLVAAPRRAVASRHAMVWRAAPRRPRRSPSSCRRRRNAAPPPARVPAGEERHADLGAARIWPDLETIVGFSKQSRAAGDRVWGRVTGFPAASATHAWVADQFRRAGLQDVQVQPYDASAPMWWATSWEVRVVAPAGPVAPAVTSCSKAPFRRADPRSRAARWQPRSFTSAWSPTR